MRRHQGAIVKANRAGTREAAIKGGSKDRMRHSNPTRLGYIHHKAAAMTIKVA
jgi:hypothetical protein